MMEDPVTKNDSSLGSDGEEAEGPTPPKKGRQANGNAGENIATVRIGMRRREQEPLGMERFNDLLSVFARH